MYKFLNVLKVFVLTFILYVAWLPSISTAQAQNYGNQIRACVQPNVTFVTPPRRDNQNPTVQYRVKLNPNGTISGIDLITSSGNVGFDTAVQKGIIACRQFPKPPQRDYPSYVEIAYNMYDISNSGNKPNSPTQNRPPADENVVAKCVGYLYGFTKFNYSETGSNQYLIEEANNFIKLIPMPQARLVFNRATNIADSLEQSYYQAAQTGGAVFVGFIQNIKRIINKDCAEYGDKYGITTYLLQN